MRAGGVKPCVNPKDADPPTPIPTSPHPQLLLQCFWLILQCQSTPARPLTRKPARSCDRQGLLPRSPGWASLPYLVGTQSAPTASPETFSRGAGRLPCQRGLWEAGSHPAGRNRLTTRLSLFRGPALTSPRPER